MAYKNKADQAAASKRHYEKNKASYLIRNKNYRLAIQNFIRDIKEKEPCMDCGLKYPYYVMDFDHIGTKENDISFLAATGRIGAVKKEIEKCEIVCSNCHRKRTHQRLRARSSVD